MMKPPFKSSDSAIVQQGINCQKFEFPATKKPSKIIHSNNGKSYFIFT